MFQGKVVFSEVTLEIVDRSPHMGWKDLGKVIVKSAEGSEKVLQPGFIVLRKDDIVTLIGNKKIRSLDGLESALDELESQQMTYGTWVAVRRKGEDVGGRITMPLGSD